MEHVDPSLLAATY